MILQAGKGISLEAGKAYTGEQYALSHKERGLLNRSSTETRTDERHEAILGSSMSGKSVTAEAGKDIVLKGSSIVGDDAVSLKAGENITLTTEQQRDYSASYKQTKKSGLMGSGLGVMLGKEEKSRDLQQNMETPVGSTVGSINGTVSWYPVTIQLLPAATYWQEKILRSQQKMLPLQTQRKGQIFKRNKRINARVLR